MSAGVERTCPGCGAVFVPVPPTRTYCRPSCRVRAAWRARQREPELFSAADVPESELPTAEELAELRLSQRDLARRWINERSGEPYSQMHVSNTKRVVEKFTFHDPRPRFRDA